MLDVFIEIIKFCIVRVQPPFELVTLVEQVAICRVDFINFFSGKFFNKAREVSSCDILIKLS
ncbi:hypothetical protein EGJ83_06200 [Pseudomonas aeruginosa]|nr:hypothetical protein EGJ83_06200 [Pseudomonas aeruginosa]